MRACVTIVGSLVLLTLGASQLAAQTAEPEGKVAYDKNCKACHGVRGSPSAAMAKQLKITKWDAAFISARSDDSLVAVMKKGGKNMKGLEGKMTPQEMAAVAKYVRELVTPKPGT